MLTLLILSVVVLGFASFLKRKLCALARHDGHPLKLRDKGGEASDGWDRGRMALNRSILLLGSVLLISGCAHYPVNAPLRSESSESGYRFQSMARTNSDDLLLMLAFSGGGTRAAALSYGVLEELRRTRVGSPGDEHRLLDDVGLISSVSGGSFTAAYYALYGDRIFTDFEPRFLKRRVQTALLLRTIAPWNCVRLASPGFGRTDLAAEYYDELLFHHATFADLMTRDGRPFLSVNATDIGSGARFEFTQDEFDLLGSDLSQFPVSRAVAASSAFPVLLTPIVLKNYSAEQRPPEPEWIHDILSDRDASSRLKYVASQARTYVRGQRQYVHLLDGGLSDNLGLRGALDRAMAHEEYTRIPGVPPTLPRRIAIIVVNAHTDADYGWDSHEYSLGLGALLGSLSQVAVSHYSFETVELFKEVMTRVSRERADTHGNVSDGQPPETATYIIELHFRQTANESDRRFFNSVRTSLQLPAKTVDRLCELARRNLAENKEFRRLVGDLGGRPRKSDTPDQPIALLR
jgi:NTE family protein